MQTPIASGWKDVIQLEWFIYQLADQLMSKADQAKWTAFDLPTRGAEPRYISLYEPDNGPVQVVLPYFRARKVAIMTLRSEAELKTLSSQAEQQ